MEPGDLNAFQQMVHVQCRERMVCHFHTHLEYLEDHCMCIFGFKVIITIKYIADLPMRKEYFPTQKVVRFFLRN